VTINSSDKYNVKTSTVAICALSLLTAIPDPCLADTTDDARIKDQEEHAETISKQRKSLQENPFNINARLRIAEALRKLGEYNEAEKELQAAEKLDAGSAAVKAEKAYLLFDQKKYADSIALLDKAIDAMPDVSVLRLRRAQACSETGQHKLAITDYIRLGSSMPDNEKIHLALALEYMKDAQPAKAEEALRYALTLAPKSLEIIEKSADFYAASGRFEEAIAAYKRCIELFPGQQNIYYKLGDTNALAGQLKEAEADYERTLKLDPSHDDAARAITALWLKHNKVGQAGSFLARYSIKHADRTWAHLLYAKLLITIDQFEDASKTLAALQKNLDYKNADFALLTAYVKNKSGNAKEALEVLRMAEQHAPADARIKFNIALLETASGNNTTAIAKYLEIKKESDLFYRARINLAYIHETAKSYSEAIRVLNALKNSDQTGFVQKKVAELQSAIAGRIKRSIAREEN